MFILTSLVFKPKNGRKSLKINIAYLLSTPLVFIGQGLIINQKIYL